MVKKNNTRHNRHVKFAPLVKVTKIPSHGHVEPSQIKSTVLKLKKPLHNQPSFCFWLKCLCMNLVACWIATYDSLATKVHALASKTRHKISAYFFSFYVAQTHTEKEIKNKSYENSTLAIFS